jgi:hypothetical protein
MKRIRVAESARAQWRHSCAREVILSLVVPAILLAGCDGGGNGPTAESQAPVIANLVALGSGSCGNPPQGFRVEVGAYSFDYTDANGDVRGGSVEVGGGAHLTLAVPSARVSITGTTSGKITVLECFVVMGNVAVSKLRRVTLVDAAGNRSNELAATL